MGIHSRDYVRESSGPTSFGGSGASITKRLIIATVVVFVLQLIFQQPYYRSELSDRDLNDLQQRHPQTSVPDHWLALDPHKVVSSGQVWRLLTYAFCHSRISPLHILFNMLFLWWFGKTLELIYGPREFLLFYLIAAVISGIAFVGLGLVMGDLTPAIGASGAVMAVVMVYAMHFPRDRIYIWGILPIEIRWLVVFYVVVDLFPVLQGISGSGTSDEVAHSAHLGGLAFGFLYKKYGLRFAGLLDRIRAPHIAGARRKIKIYQPSTEEPSENLDKQVDVILQKIHEQGESRLTSQERKILKAASNRYKNR